MLLTFTSGHGVKVVRALAYGERICKPYIGKSGFPMQDDMWWKAAAMCEFFLFEVKCEINYTNKEYESDGHS